MKFEILSELVLKLMSKWQCGLNQNAKRYEF